MPESALLNLEQERENLKLKMKAFFARNLFGAPAYFRTLAKEDPMVIKSLELFTEQSIKKPSEISEGF